MLTLDVAKRKGINECIDQLGRSFVQKYADSSTSAFGQVDDSVYCFVGVDDNPQPMYEEDYLILNNDKFPYRSSCLVNMVDGAITHIETVAPVDV